MHIFKGVYADVSEDTTSELPSDLTILERLARKQKETNQESMITDTTKDKHEAEK
jgi:hypothetical protein